MMKKTFGMIMGFCLSIVVCMLLLTSCGHRHAFGEWTVTKERTCTEDGEQMRTCSCGETETETITKGHTPREATCERAEICTVCKAELAPAKGHDFGEPIVTAPTCTIRGTTAAECKRCPKKQVTDSVPPLGHIPDGASTCLHAKTCIVCNAEIEPAKGHRYTATVVEPTCTGDMGYTVWSCNECGYTYNDNYKESKGHQIYVPTVIKEEIDLNYSVINDSSYPFRTQNGILVSTNHSDDTVSTYTIIALKDFFFEAECRASSETNDHLIIKLNDEILFSKGGELEWLEANIEMKAGDTLTFIFPVEQSMDELDALFTAQNCETIILGDGETEGGIHHGYTIRAELKREPVEVAPATESTEAVMENRTFVSMAQRTYMETKMMEMEAAIAAITGKDYA